MRRFIIRGPGKECAELNAGSIDEALSIAQSRFPDKQVESDATEVIYVCDAAQDMDTFQMKFQ